ncbi:glycine cleavage system aminomethyltransferase GcvT [Thalassospira sp.]|jgi:aminomethyltransferase|uniref:glycine cleavage system aminomethyltransferase GcvT n=1 Tax=Thalassospira sp. TaxID=1912094 RepID=UPI001B1CAE7C|nr:glycine cleavage system aminomethyltransferase GcvT [Thalassospira sp.]MBO6806113.1 glycine cleavage system aminomethyltransferase GcvT [Thalassospira sp.]MBO6840586.1 glycine cleavage system aminomethyltransferase GcvT [Thalassospira sp.]|tara:strand:- start:179 stop:1321 length:1143 start_codon:yes stop_codon:yes gene_type:complete
MFRNDCPGEGRVDQQTELLQTALYDLHVELGAKMVPFAGYAMPVQYPLGVKGEHLHTRAKAGLFDVSHMGQVRLTGENRVAELEKLVPGDIAILKPGRTRYSAFTQDDGTILDDLMITNAGDSLFLVINAACKDDDIVHMRANLGDGVSLEEIDDRALLALQGPDAAKVLARFAPAVADLKFMSFAEIEIAGSPCFVTRSGYTGEDGFEISVPNADAEALARKLLAEEEVEAIGLGARDSLRLEAGLCLYGNDIDTTTTPVEGDLNWIINKRRRAEGGFKGADVILDQLENGADRKRVGIKPEGKAPAREHTQILNSDGEEIGEITSGGFGPTVDGPIAMGYVAIEFSEPGTKIDLMVRGKARPAEVVELPFAPHRYFRG